MSRIKSVARNLNLILTREISELLGVVEGRLNERADAYENTLDQRFDERVGTIERNFDERSSSLETRLDERTAAIEQRIDQRTAEIAETTARNFDERLSVAETNFDARLESVDRTFTDRAGNYESALDARIEERLQTIETRTEDRQNSTESRLEAQFAERSRAVDGRLDDRLSRIEHHIDERFGQIERRSDERIENHERRTDQSLERNRVDILDRTDIMLQILEQRLDKHRREVALLHEQILQIKGGSGRTAKKSSAAKDKSEADEDLPEPAQIFRQSPEQQIRSFRKLARNRGAIASARIQNGDSTIYQRILDWKTVSSEGLNNFSTDEQEVVDYILSFISDQAEKHYVMQHMRRFLATLQRIPPPQRSTDRLLELGSLLHLAPAIRKFTGYNEICGADLWQTGEQTINETLKQVNGNESHSIELRNYNVERDHFPYPDGHFRVVLCCELIEHLQTDPMHMLWECNRVLADDGYLLLTTPNITSCRSIEGVLIGCTPYLLSQYNRETPIDQHNREYAPFEIGIALAAAGFTVAQLETDDVWLRSNPTIMTLLEELNLPTDMRGDNIFALARKTGAPTERYPKELYID